MRHLGVLAALLLAAGATQAQAQTQTERARARALAVAQAERALERWTAQELVTFRDEEDFAAYFRAARRAQEARWAARNAGRIQWAEAQTAGAQPAQPVCTLEDKPCRIRREEAAARETVTVTGSRVRPAPLTNNQEAGVDEGDIVKQLDHYLLILQDGRVFVVDMEGGPNRDRLVLVDRADVYRHSSEEAWYDELTVHGDRVIVTGYSYDLGASEIAVFRLGENGRLTRDGVFQIRSADYYDRDNYSTRVVGDRLVLYTPLPVEELDGETFEWPRLRRVPPGRPNGQEEAGGDAEAAFRAGAPLLSARRLHRPLATIADPSIHMVTTCALGEPAPATGLGCESRAFVGSRGRQFYVAGEQAYLWTSSSGWDDFPEEPEECAAGFRPRRTQTNRAIVYRIGLADSSAGVVGASGWPQDQLGLDASNGRFRALVSWHSLQCLHSKEAPLAYFSIEESAFQRRLRPAPDEAFTQMPEVGGPSIENRFTDRYLVFGSRSQYDLGDRPGEDGHIGTGRAAVVPIDRPEGTVVLDLPHRVWRAERAGDNVVLTGYGDSQGLDLSVIDLRGETPRIASSVQLEGRFESEGRSHAFNSLVGADGSGLIGLPTVLQVGDSDRYAWRSSPSDVSFLSLDAVGRLQSLGALEVRSESGDGGRYYEESDDPNVYSCQVSCIDWYGNSRPLFTGGRVFGLTATELVEGRVEGGRIGEVQRIDLTKAELPPHLRRPAVTAPSAGEGE